MTPLQFTLLSLLAEHGTLSEVVLWRHSKERYLTTVVTACADLRRNGEIEPPSDGPHAWQLTPKGRATFERLNTPTANMQGGTLGTH